jgi:hypothetical protein
MRFSRFGGETSSGCLHHVPAIDSFFLCHMCQLKVELSSGHISNYHKNLPGVPAIRSWRKHMRHMETLYYLAIVVPASEIVF